MANVDLFSYLPSLQVTSAEILEAEKLSEQLVSAQFPDLDLREGTALRDAVIRPSATLLALARKGIAYYFSQNTLDNATDATPQAIVDSLMSNWFMTRQTGQKVVINARLFFAIKKNVTLTSSVFFSPDNILKFFPSSAQAFSSASLTFDPFSNSYYVDVDLTAEQPGAAYELSKGGLVYFSTFDPYFLRAEINFLRQTGIDTETNTNFIARSKTAISTRNLINMPSISSRVLADFPNITTVYTVGKGDVEMWRDQVKVIPPALGSAIWIHTGGKVDVYVRCPTATSLVQVLTDNLGVATLTGPIYKMARSVISGGTLADTVTAGAPFTVASTYKTNTPITSISVTGTTATVTVPDHGLVVGRYVEILGSTNGFNGVQLASDVPTKDTFTFQVPLGWPALALGALSMNSVNPAFDWGFSANQSLAVDFGVSQANRTVSFDITFFQEVESLHSYMSDKTMKVLAADYLARGFNLYELDITVVGYNGVAPNSDTIMTVLSAYVNSLAPSQAFIMSDAIAALNTAGILTIKTPIGITYKLYNRDLTPITTGTILDTFNPLDSTAIFKINSVSTSSTTV